MLSLQNCHRRHRGSAAGDRPFRVWVCGVLFCFVWEKDEKPADFDETWGFGDKSTFFSECMFTSKFVILVLLKFVEIAFVKILRRHKKEP